MSDFLLRYTKRDQSDEVSAALVLLAKYMKSWSPLQVKRFSPLKTESLTISLVRLFHNEELSKNRKTTTGYCWKVDPKAKRGVLRHYSYKQAVGESEQITGFCWHTIR